MAAPAPASDAVAAVTAPAAAVATVLPSPISATPVVPVSGALGALSAPTGVVDIPCSDTAGSINFNELSANYSFRSHPNVEWALRMFSSVTLERVQAVVTQGTVYAASSANATLVRRTKVGLAPRAVAHSVTTGTGTAATTTGMVRRVPHLVLISHNTTVPTKATLVWARNPGPGELPFPPGVQVDLRPLEVLFNYVEFFIGNLDVHATSTDKLWNVDLEFVVRCSGAGFGTGNFT